MLDQINQWLTESEWYDNHKISTILECRRKAFLHLLFQGGLATTVGPGAWFGSSIHKGLEVYYNGWGRQSLSQRKDAAFRAFLSTHQHLFSSLDPERLQNKHTPENGLVILDDYFSTFAAEDQDYEPINNELAGIITISPQEGDPPFFQRSFLYVFRLDGLWRRSRDSSLWVKETKTTGNVDQEIAKLKMSRQVLGYAYSIKQWPDGDLVKGILADVIQVAVGPKSARREHIFIGETQLREWRAGTITIVEEWRSLCRRAQDEGLGGKLETFYQDDNSCLRYGRCCFYDLCAHSVALADGMAKNTWTPFQVMEGE